MCFFIESNVCAKVRILLNRKSFYQSNTERRAPKGGLRRCSGVNKVSHVAPCRFAGTLRVDAGADVHTASTQTPRKIAVFMGRGACRTLEGFCCTWRCQLASAHGGKATWYPFSQCGGRSYGLGSGVCPHHCRAHLLQTQGLIEV